MADTRGDGGAGAAYANRTLGLWLALLVALGAFAAATAWGEVRQPRDAPPFRLLSTGYEDGVAGEPVAFSLADYAGRTVVLDLMAVSCAPCRLVTEEVLKPLRDEHAGDARFAILSIDTYADPALWGGGPAIGEGDADLVRLQRDTGAAWRHARDTDGVHLKYAAVAIPKIVVVDGEGRIVYAHSGAQELDEVREAVAASLAGEARPVPVLRAGRIPLAAIAGVAAFFAPCSVGLLPAYLGVLARGAGPAGAPRTAGIALRVALGLVAADAALAALLLAFRPVLAPRLPHLAAATAALLVVVGALSLAGFPWERLRLPGRGAPGQGALAFGAAYGVAAFGCTGPVLLPILLGGFGEGAATGLAVLAVYAGTLALFTLAVAGLVAAGRDGLLRGVVRHARAVNRAAAVLLVLGGLWLLWAEWRAGALG